MSNEERNLVTAEDFGPEYAGQRIGWSAITGYGIQPDRMRAIHLMTTTIGEAGATLEYELREKDGEEIKAYWSDGAKGFLAAAGVTIIIDTENAPDEQERVGPYWSFNDDMINGTSDGKILRCAADGRTKEDELDELKVWADSPAAVMADVKKSMSHSGLADYYPTVYYTANVLMAHDNFRLGTGLGQASVETILLPDDSMRDTTILEIAKAQEVIRGLSAEAEEDTTMLRNLTVFGDIPGEQIPQAFKLSRGKVAGAEQRVIAAEKKLLTQHGVFLPTGSSRSWPYMDASLPPTDERAFSLEMNELRKQKPRLVEGELEREVEELERRLRFAREGVIALKLLARAEIRLVTPD